MEDCCNCLSLKKQLEDTKQKHLLDFRTIKQKIISTDSLIRSYQGKCQEFDKQSKCVVELVSKLDIAQRSADVVNQQLKKSFELVEPLQKKCNELEREKVLQFGEIQAQQDRLRGLENLVNQLQSVIKENEVSNNSLKLDVSLHTEELEEYKNRQKKNEAQISKLNEQVLTEKKANKALQKELTKSQSQVKTLLGEAEESKKLNATLQQQQNTCKGQSNDCKQQRNTSLEKQIVTLKTEAEGYKQTIRKLKEELCKAKQQNTNEKVENKIKSPTTPRRSPRKRKGVTLKQGKETCASLDQKRPLTRLQQKHLIEEIEKKSVQVKSSESISPSRQESLTSESEDDADEMGTLLDKVNEMLDMPYCPSLSPLPPSPTLDANSVDAFGNNDPDDICHGNGDDAIDNDNRNHIGVTDEPDKNNPNDGNVNNSKDNLDDKLSKDDHDKILQNESRGKKRELVDCSDTFMILRSKKRIKSTTSESGPSSNDENDPQNVKKTESVEGEPLVNISVTGNKRVEGVTEGVLEVKPKRRRRRRRLSSNDDPDEQCFESSDTSTVESHVSETRKHSSGSFTAENGNNMETVVSEASDENCSEKKGAETNYKENGEVLKCLQNIINTVVDENSGKICDASRDVNGTESCTQNEQIGAVDCFDVVKDLVVNSDLSALQEDLVKSRDNVVKEGDKIDGLNENNKTAKSEILDSVDDINTTVSAEIKQNIKNKNAKFSDNENMDYSVSTRTIENDLSSSSFDGSGHPEATSSAIVTKNTCKIQHETKDKASTISDCISTSSEKCSRTIESDLSKSFVDENGFLKAPSDDLVTTNICKTQHEPKDEASIIADCVSTGSEEVSKTIESDLSKSFVDENGFLKATGDYLVTTNTCKTQQEPKDKASTISDCVSNSSEKEITGTDGDDLNKSPFDKNGSPKVTRHDLITTSSLKTQHETKHEASTISDCVSASNKKEVITTDANDLNSLSGDESGFSKASSPDLVTTNTRKTQRETKDKASTISDCVSASNKKEVIKTNANDVNSLSGDESGFLKATSPDLIATNTRQSPQESIDEASAISDCVSTSSEDVTKTIKNDYRKLSVNKSGFLKAKSSDLVTTNTRKTQHETKHKASTISDCVSTSSEDVTKTIEKDYRKLSVDESGFLKAKSSDLVTTNTRKTQETKDKASTISDGFSTITGKEVTSKSSVHESGFLKNTSPDLSGTKSRQSPQESIDEASAISDCVPISNEEEVTRTDGNDLNRSSVDENGFQKAPSQESDTTNTRKTQRETKDKASTISDVFTSGEKEVIRTDENDRNKSSVVPKAPSSDSVTKDNLKTELKTKDKASTVSDCVSGSNEKIIDRTIETDRNKPAIDKSGFPKAPSSDLISMNTRKAQNETSKEAVYASKSNVGVPSEKSATQVIDKDPIICDEITPTTSPPRDSLSSLEQITPLSPIPNTPKKGGRSVEIPCFDSLGDLPLSPIPPSPSPRADEESTSTNITFDESVVQNPKEARVDKQQKLNKNELPQDCLRRYPGVKEVQYTVFILTKLKNKEVTLEDLISAFSVQKNVKNHNPICNGIITVLKLTHEDEEHALMEKCAERYERCCEGTGDPIVSEFELQVLIAVNRLCKIQRHANLLIKLVKWSGMNVCELFNSGKNDAGLLAMCRLYTGASRLMGEGSYVRVLCYDLLKQNKRYSMTERMILSMALVWPKVLGEGVPILTIHPEAVTISGPPYSPFLATLQVTLLSREMSCEQTRQCLQRLCGWCDIPKGNNVFGWLARDLARILRVTNDPTSDERPGCSSTIKDVAFESIKSLALLAFIMGWKWTNNVLIREILWPFFNEWKIQLFDVKQTVLDNESQKAERNAKASNAGDSQSMVESECVNNEQLVENSNEAVSFKHDGNMDVTIANILHLLGVLGSERLQKGEIVNLDAVINLMCVIVTRPACEKVSFNIQHTAASALLDIVSADPVKIMQVLENWMDSNEALTGQFARRMKDVRSHMWSNIEN